MRRSFAGLLTVAAVLVTGATPALAATRVVDDDRRQCPAAQFTAIQAAVDAAQPSDTVLVCRGLYPEQVQIGDHDETFEDKSNLRVISQANAGAVVRSARPFSVDGRSGDFVSGASISRFRIEGPGPSSGTGISLDFSGQTLIEDNIIRSAAIGIDQGDSVGSTIRDNLIRDYGDSGVTVAVGSSLSLGTSADLRSNTVIGRPGTTGVRFFAGTLGGGGPNVSGLVFGNTIADNGTAGVEVFNGIVDVRANKMFGNGVGLSLRLGFGMTIANNTITHNDRQGILVVDSGPNSFASNNAYANGGIDCEDRTAPGGSGTAGTDNTWTGNLGLESTPPGICKRKQ